MLVQHIQLLLHVELQLWQHLLLQLRELRLMSRIRVPRPGPFVFDPGGTTPGH